MASRQAVAGLCEHYSNDKLWSRGLGSFSGRQSMLLFLSIRIDFRACIFRLWLSVSLNLVSYPSCFSLSDIETIMASSFLSLNGLRFIGSLILRCDISSCKSRLCLLFFKYSQFCLPLRRPLQVPLLGARRVHRGQGHRRQGPSICLYAGAVFLVSLGLLGRLVC